MIKGDYVIIKQITHNFDRYNKLGYDVIKGKELSVKIIDLPNTSHIKIDAMCDICGNEKSMEYRSYCDRISNHNFYVCSKCRFEKTKITNNLKYGVENVFQLEIVKDKSSDTKLEKYGNRNYYNKEKYKETCMKRYGVENMFQSPNIIIDIQLKTKITKIKNGSQISDENLTEWQLYKKNVIKLTKRNKKNLLENWNGFDYYDDEFIKNNHKLFHGDPNYPTIDHKISIRQGFDNKIPVETISNIENLCFTKRYINASKYTKNEKEFLKYNKLEIN